MKPGKFMAVTLALSLLAASPVIAEESAPKKESKPEEVKKTEKGEKQAKETKLEEMVVTATRTEKSIADAPGSVSVVTKKEIEKRNIQSVDQALTLLPGVFDTRSKGLMGTTASVTMRGMPLQGRTLLMMDGVPLNDAYSSGVQWGGIYAKDLRQIEVLKGPSSSLYGGSAMAGVVNLMTSMPTKREFTLSGGYGDEWNNGEGMSNLWTIHGSYGDRFGKLSLYGSFGYRSTDGYRANEVVVSSAPPAGTTGAIPTTDNKGAARYLIGDTGNNNWWDYTGNFRIQYDFSENTNLRFAYMRTTNKYSYDDPHTYLRNAAGDPVYNYGTVRQSGFASGDGYTAQDIYTISGETLLGDIKGKLTFSILDQGDNWYITPTSGAPASGGATVDPQGGTGKLSETPNRTYFTDIQLSAPILQKHVITGGFTFRHDVADNRETPLYDWKDEDSQSGAPTYKAGGVSMTYSAYLQAEIALLDSLTFYAGVRDDFWVSQDGYTKQTTAPAFSEKYDGTSKNSINPRGALVWKPLDGTTLRMSGGKAFRSPTIYQQYRTWSSQTASTVTINRGNPSLQPEYVLSWDVGIDQDLWKGAKFKAAYFQNYIHNLIYNVTTNVSTSGGVTTTEKQQSNVGAATSTGFEVEAEQSFGKHLRLFANYTYTDAHITEFNSSDPSQMDYKGNTLAQVPRHMINMGMDASYGPASLFLSGRYVAKRWGDENSDKINNVYTSYDPYFLMDLKTSYKVTDFATLSFSVDNLLDRQYYSYYKAPGRSWFLSADLKF